MGFQEAICSVYTNYFNFKGRATRSEYWYFGLFYVLVILFLLFGLVGGILGSGGMGILAILLGILYFVFMLGSIIPAFAVFVRRLHDTGRSGWWVLLSFVPQSVISVFNFLPMESYMALTFVMILVALACNITMIVFLVQPSAPANEYGPNPFEEEDDELE